MPVAPDAQSLTTAAEQAASGGARAWLAELRSSDGVALHEERFSVVP